MKIEKHDREMKQHVSKKGDCWLCNMTTPSYICFGLYVNKALRLVYQKDGLIFNELEHNFYQYGDDVYYSLEGIDED